MAKYKFRPAAVSRDFVESLFENAANESAVSLYKSEGDKLSPDAVLPLAGQSEIELEFANENDSESDATNAVELHKKWSGLSPQMAADERLWVFLTYGPLRNYVISRWAPTQPSELRDYCFVRGGAGRALRRNAISRLWWAAEMTCQPWATFPELKKYDFGDPYKLVNVLFRKQDIYQQLVERRFGADRRLLATALIAIDSNWKVLSTINSREPIRRLIRKMNMRCGYSNVSAISVDELLAEFNEALKPG